ncbi:TRAP transporter substrate-binding protein [Chelatococcus reniformis]|uniref:C4-dicarboxylate ABC transporter n=1 Tax=Chelatococcus reniformis TaxID=1494448 RepID=A0A916U6T6_9HYPH|nr:TRAP transporter substrate-binding protein DctP [Chelatococcus reniformis]GGC60783.1 C4-dicarboxylate ABC transporter [Chelatococcus reniformis]
MQRMISRGVMGAGLAIGVVALLGAGTAIAETIKLKLADRLPQEHYVARYTTEYWIDEVQKGTGGKVAIQRFPSERLGKSKDMLMLTKSGVVDIGEYVPGYLGDQMPLSTVGELPGIVPTACAASFAYEALARPGGLLDKAELKRQGLRLLYAVGLPAYQLFTSKQIGDLASLEGLKVRSTGPAMDSGLRQLGITPIRMSAAELNESFSRGTVDGTAFPAASIFSYDLQKQAKYATTGLSFGSSITFYAISTRVWDKLPADVQKVMAEAGERTTRHGCKLIDADDKAAFERLREGGTALVTLPDQQREKFNALLSPVAVEWADGQDKKGRAGSETLKAFRAAIPTP